LRFIERICLPLQERFADDELKEWVVFDTQAIQTQTNFDFGKEELMKLAAKYKYLVSPDTTLEKLLSEYNDLKFILREKLQSGTLKTFSNGVSFVLTEERLSAVATLVNII